MVENITGVAHDIIKNLEYTADKARWLILVLGVAGLAGLSHFRNDKNKGFTFFLYISMIPGIIPWTFSLYRVFRRLDSAYGINFSPRLTECISLFYC